MFFRCRFGRVLLRRPCAPRGIVLAGVDPCVRARLDPVNPTNLMDKQNTWFGPDNDTQDLLDLFSKPDSWARSRSQIGVFKFGPQQLKETGQPSVNSLDQLVKVDAFRKPRSWGIPSDHLTTPTGKTDSGGKDLSCG
jgi:hypothetical protein